MNQSIFFTALSTSILVSLVQGLVIYFFIRLITGLFPGMSASQRFKLLYAGMVVIFCGFMFSLSRTYLTELSKVNPGGYETMVHDNLVLGNHYQKNFFTDYSFWISVIYFSGLILHFIFLAIGYYKLSGIHSSKKLWLDKSWDERLSTLCSKLHISKNVRLKLAERTFSPFTAGFLKPMIIFPIAMINRLSPEQVEAILLHELAHIRRGDYLLNIIQKIMEAILFFNPMIWLIAKDLKKEREFACDDLVLEHNTNPETYAKALLHIAESQLKDCNLGIAATDGNKYTLFNRIKRITNMKTENTQSKQGLVALIGLAAICVSIAWAMPDTTNVKKNQAAVKAVADPVSTIAPVPAPSPVPQEAPKLPVDTTLAPVLPVPPLPPLSASADTNEIKKYFNSPDWKAQIDQIKQNAEVLAKKFNGPEWKNQMELARANAEEMKKKFETPEWQKHMAELKANAEEIAKKYESPEGKKRLAEIKANAEEIAKKYDSPEGRKHLAEMKASAEEMAKKFDSPEWKKQMAETKANAEEMAKKFETPEWKKHMAEIKANAEEMAKKYNTPEWKAEVDRMRKDALEVSQKALDAEKAKKDSIK
jgi:bla regulator protein BlaR1